MSRWVPALRLTGIGFYIGICIAGGTLLGWWLGDKNPLFMIVGLLVGLGMAIYGVYRMIKPLMNSKADKENG